MASPLRSRTWATVESHRRCRSCRGYREKRLARRRTRAAVATVAFGTARQRTGVSILEDNQLEVGYQVMVGCVGFGPESGDMLRGPDEETEVPWLWKWWLRVIAGRRPSPSSMSWAFAEKKSLKGSSPCQLGPRPLQYRHVSQACTCTQVPLLYHQPDGRAQHSHCIFF